MTKLNLEEIEARCESYLAHYLVASDDLRALLAADIPALVERVRELESVLREALARQAMQHTGPMIGGACTEACVKCDARRLLDGGK